jgi:LacI family transcriptional regulator
LDATLRLMRRHPDITAIFACNDNVAVSAVMVALRQLGYRVPEDVSVVGFDNTSNAAESSPALTTIRVDRELMGIMGVQRLIEKAANHQRSPVKTVVSTRLIKRDSVRQPGDQPPT